jgi:hypothetical protein
VPEDVGLLFAARVEPVPVMAAAGGLGKRGEGEVRRPTRWRRQGGGQQDGGGRGGRAGGLAARGREGVGSQGGPGLVIPCREREIRGKHHTQIRGVTSHIYSQYGWSYKESILVNPNTRKAYQLYMEGYNQ